MRKFQMCFKWAGRQQQQQQGTHTHCSDGVCVRERELATGMTATVDLCECA